MDTTKLIELLGAEWDEPNGCFWKLRQGIFERSDFERFEGLVRSVDLGDAPYIDRRLVSLLWFAPTFMTWQRRRVAEKGGDTAALDEMAARIADLLLVDVFGPP